MTKTLICSIRLGLATGILLLAFGGPQSWAVSFLTFDARSIAMGGAGVVTARSHNASLFNPALLIDHDPRRQTRLHAHTYVGARLVDRDNFLDSARYFRDRYEGISFEELLDDLTGDIAQLAPSEVTNGDELRSAADRVRSVQADINRLSNKPLRVSGSYGVAFSYPVGRWSWGGYYREYLVLGSVVRIADEDNAAINNITGTVDAFAGLLDQVAELYADADELEQLTIPQAVERATALLQSVLTLNTYIDFDALQTDVEQDALAGKGVRDYLRTPIPSDFYSTIDSRGAQVAEQGLSVARSFEGNRYLTGRWHLGVTLKQVDFTTISYSQRVNEFSLQARDDPANRRNHRRRANIDVGLLYDLPDAWQLGLVVRNLVPYDFTTVDGDQIPLRPVARMGLGYIQKQLRLSLDLDITRNEPLGFDPDKQYASFGAEWFVWRNTAVRAGIRTNLVNGETLPSIGLGLGGDHGHFDVAVGHSLNGDEWGASLQAGLAF